MDFDKNSKKIGTIFSFLAAIFLFIQGFAPDEIENKNIDFVIAVLKNGIFELVVLLVVGLFLYKYRLFEKWIFPTKEKKILLIITLLITAGLNFNNLKNLARARAFHYLNIGNAHKYQLYESISKNLNTGEFNSAVKKIEKVISFYPDEKYGLNYLRKQLIGSSDYAQNFYKISDNKVIQKSENGNEIINRTELIQLIISYSIYPHPKYEDDLTLAKNKIDKILNQIIVLHPEFLKNPASKKAKQFIKQYNWFLCDNEIQHVLKQRKIDETKYLLDFFRKHSKEESIEILKKKWFFKIIEDQFTVRKK